MNLRLAFYLLATGFGAGMIAHSSGLPEWVYVFISAAMVGDIMAQTFQAAYEWDKERGRWWTKKN